MNSPKRIPKLRGTQVQKNYVAIWYSVIIHFALVIFLVNYNKLEIQNFLYETKGGIIEVIKSYNNQDLMKKKINELFTKRENDHS